MKKLMMMAMLFATVSFATAQVAPKASSNSGTKTTKMAAKDAKHDSKMAAKDVKQDSKMAAKDTKKDAKQAAGLKKDGTPDMRLKANKEKKEVPKGPTKKDGSADMRYKANKAK